MGPIAKITVGQEFPTGNEDRLAELGSVWNTTALEINQLLGELNTATAATFESLAGAPAEQFAQFVNQLGQTLPVMALSAAQLGAMADNIALEIEYAKYMIILQLAWMAAEVAYLSATLFGSAAIPAVIAAGRFAIQIILRELFIAVLSSIVMQVGMDVAVQIIQFLKGDRTHWDLNATKSAFEMGALGGAVGGGLGQILRHLAPDFTKSFLGSVTHGALTGLGTTEASNLIFGTHQDLGLGAAAGGLGGAISHGHTLREGGSPERIEVPKLEMPFSPEMLQHRVSGESRPGASGRLPGEAPEEQQEHVPDEHPTGQRPGEEDLHLPDAPKPFDPSELPDPSHSVLVTDLPSAPSGTLPPLREQVERRVDELGTLARTAGLPETQWRPRAASVREAVGAGDLPEAARRLHDFRTTVENEILDQRLTDFRAHVETGFSRLGELGVNEDAWRGQVEAVERAQRTGNPVLLDSRLKEYTDFVERHLPVEVVAENSPRTFDSGVEQIRREMTTVSDPAVREALRKDLEWHEQAQQRLDRLAQSDPESDVMLRRTIAQEETAQSPQEVSEARGALRDFQNQRELQRQLDDVRDGTAQTELERRFDALRERALPDTRGQELLQRVLDANTPQEHEQALRDLVAHNQLTPQERQLGTLREGLLPADDPQREQLVQKVESARTPEEARQAQQELKQYTDRQIQEQQQNFTERLHTQEDARAQAGNEDLLRRLDTLNGGSPQDPREAELRQRLDAATNPQERAQIIHELGVHQQGVLQQRVDAATTPQQRKEALDTQAKFNNWTPAERRLAELRTVLNPGGAPEADAHRAELVRQVENARTPEAARQAQLELKQHTDRQIEQQTRQLEDRLRQQGGGAAAAAAHADLMRRFEELRGDGSHQDPREAELMRRMENAGSPQEARTAERNLSDYLAGREQQRQVAEQQRLAQVRVHEQEVTQLRDQLTQQRRTGAPEEVVQQTERQLEQAQQRLATVRTHDENTAALRRELEHQIDRPASGSDRPGAGSGRGGGGGTESGGSGPGSRLDRLVQEGISRRAEQDLARTQEEQQFLRQGPGEHDAFTLDELDDLPSAPTARPEPLPDVPTGRLEGLPDAPTGRLDGLPDAPTGRLDGLPDAPTGRL
ncbi:WXG100-like domain-containing protein, partial [Streptomyces sp. NPDC001617]